MTGDRFHTRDAAADEQSLAEGKMVDIRLVVESQGVCRQGFHRVSVSRLKSQTNGRGHSNGLHLSSSIEMITLGYRQRTWSIRLRLKYIRTMGLPVTSID